MKIIFTKVAMKDLKKIPNPFKKNIQKEVLHLEDFPNVSNVKKLVSSQYFRLRVGTYRVLFLFENEQITITNILHRSKAYD